MYLHGVSVHDGDVVPIEPEGDRAVGVNPVNQIVRVVLCPRREDHQFEKSRHADHEFFGVGSDLKFLGLRVEVYEGLVEVQD